MRRGRRVLKMPDGALGDVLEELRRERVVLPVGDGRLWAAQ